MTTENLILMKLARRSLDGKWGLAVGTFFVFILILSSIIYLVISSLGWLLMLSLIGPILIGISLFSSNIVRHIDAKFTDIFYGFNSRFIISVVAFLLMVLYVLLWTLLLIIPGIIAALSYSQTFFILADDETIGATEALAKSKAMMDGYKLKLFLMSLRFLGWGLLSILTLFIGLFWLIPYMFVSYAKFYDYVKLNYHHKTKGIENIES
jgi:uncharacterized membrane protein